MKSKRTSKATTLLVLSGLTLGTLGMSGCNNAGEGLFTGAALGAVTGLIVGSTTGNAGEGAAVRSSAIRTSETARTHTSDLGAPTPTRTDMSATSTGIGHEGITIMTSGGATDLGGLFAVGRI